MDNYTLKSVLDLPAPFHSIYGFRYDIVVLLLLCVNLIIPGVLLRFGSQCFDTWFFVLKLIRI